MKILYYSWDENNSRDLIENIQNLGHDLTVFKAPLEDKLHDAQFAAALCEQLEQAQYDCIFTFNFFPIIAKVAHQQEIKYISWVYDSPHLTLYSQAVFLPEVFIFHFDRNEVLRLQAHGVKHIYHLPLAVDVSKYTKLCPDTPAHYQYDISFLGSLYNDEYNFFNQIKNIPDYQRGFLDSIIYGQMNIFGYDLASNLITDKYTETLRTFAQFNLDKELFLKDTDLFIQILQKKITSVERVEILKDISEAGGKVTHFGPTSDPSLDKVDFQGYADYNTKMPQIFHNSKINLNITLRSILSGIPLRCLDIMVSGGFLISNYQPELAEYFEDGKDLVLYTSRYDLLTKVDYYLRNPEEREEIARNGRARVNQLFPCEKQLNEIFNMITFSE